MACSSAKMLAGKTAPSVFSISNYTVNYQFLCISNLTIAPFFDNMSAPQNSHAGIFQLNSPRIRRWQQERLSKRKRGELLRFNLALYGNSGDKKMPAKKSEVATMDVPFKFLDAHGIEQTLDLAKVKNLGDTAYAESQKLFPNATQCMIGKDGVRFDEDGRENVLGQNIVILEARRLEVGDFGPWFLLRCAHPTLGEISVPAPGRIANEAVAQMSGIDLKTGEQTGPSEFPVWCRFEFVPDKGKFNGYFVIFPAIQELTESDE